MSEEKKQPNGNEIKFSICIPNYNYAHYIGKTIQSVLDQSYQNFEIIIADNASEDASVSVVRSFRDERIKIRVNSFNIGFSPNLNKATEEATGDYIILLSSDDLMQPEALSSLVENIRKFDGIENPLVLLSSISIIDGKDRLISSKNALIEQISEGLRKEKLLQKTCVSLYEGHTLLKHALSNNFVIVGRFLSTCYARKIFEAVEGYNSITEIMPDAHFSHKLMFTNPKTIVIQKELFSYRVHSDNNYSAIYDHGKLAWDAYTLTNLYSDKLLKPLGITQGCLKKRFINYWGNVLVWQTLFFGRLSYCLRLWHISWASYPNLYRYKLTAWSLPFVFPIIAILRFLAFDKIIGLVIRWFRMN